MMRKTKTMIINTKNGKELSMTGYLKYIVYIHQVESTEIELARQKAQALDGYGDRLIDSPDEEKAKALRFLHDKGDELSHTLNVLNMIEQLECQ